MEELRKALQDQRMGFCAGVATLVVMAPPYWEPWLAGELGWEPMTVGVAAVAAVARGVVWLGFRLAGEKPPKSLNPEPNNEG